MTRISWPAWHFDYAPLPSGGGFDGSADRDLVVATVEDLDPARLVELAGNGVPDLAVTPLFSGHAVFWTRVESSQPIEIAALTAALRAGGVGVRYVTSARRGSQAVPPPLDLSESRLRAARDWTVRAPSVLAEEDTPWRWFVRAEGADVHRESCGTGAGTRLAVIDNDGQELDQVGLDAEVLVGVNAAPRGQAHAAMMIGWAVGARRADGAFYGVAPDASPRVYFIPKPGEDVWTLPLAILRAVDDGADVVVCATYVEGLTSPLLDDALEVAVRLGRGGRGTAVVMPTGREMSSPEGATHSSLSLATSDPAADPRVFCVGPSARDGAWFLWRDRRGRLRPFANRGPAVRWLAPGDDMAYPFVANDRPAHAESSGASAVAGGVLLLLLGRFPDLTLGEAETCLRLGVVPVDAERQVGDPELADRRDLEPIGTDPDAHNAKHGYGRLSTRNACAIAADPIAQGLVRMGHADAATRYLAATRAFGCAPSTDALAHWAARCMLADAGLAHAVTSLLRALRLTCRDCSAAPSVAGQWLRQLCIIIRFLARASPPAPLAEELARIDRDLRSLGQAQGAVFESNLLGFFYNVFGAESGAPSRVVELCDSRPRGGTASSPGAGR